MIKQIDKQIDINSRANELQPFEKANEKHEEININPEKVLIDLKERERTLDKLITEGHHQSDIKELKYSISKAISDLEDILNDPDLDALSEDIV